MYSKLAAILLVVPSYLFAQTSAPTEAPTPPAAAEPSVDQILNDSDAPTAQASVTPPAAPTPAKPIEKPSEKAKEVDLSQNVAVTDTRDVLAANRNIQTPMFPRQDLFIRSGGSAVIDILDLCKCKPSDLYVGTTVRDVIVDSQNDPAGGGYRIVAGNTRGSTQILFYQNIQAGKKSERGRLIKVYRVTVTDEDLLNLLQEVKGLLGMIEGLEINIVGSQIVLDGQLLIASDLRRIREVMDRYKGKPLLNLVEISPLAFKLLAEKMEEEIAGGKDRPREIKVSVLNNRFVLEGTVDRRYDREAAVKICQGYLQPKYYLRGAELAPPTIDQLGDCVDRVRIRAGQPQEPDPIISIRVDFVTMNRDYIKSFDFNWSPGLKMNAEASYNTDIGKFLANFTASLNGLFPKLQSAASHGHARILKSATLLVRDGVNARAGGDEPPPALIDETTQILLPEESVDENGRTRKTLRPVDVVTRLSILAKSVPGSDKINMDLDLSQTEIVSAPKGAAFATTKNTVNTSVVVGNTESAALGGIISERRRVSFTRDPASQDSDFNLFEFGRAHSFGDEKSQFIVFVTPTKMRTPAEGTETLKRKFRLRK